tara:strand:- start:36939 stop:37169 length:231 start_codon:yes stop_codon:yes gene_type:complete
MKKLDKKVYVVYLEKRIDVMAEEIKELKTAFQCLVNALEVQQEKQKYCPLLQMNLDRAKGILEKGEHIQDSPQTFF